MKKKFIEINLNKLYSPLKPSVDEWKIYKGKLAEQLPEKINLREVSVLLTGTAPPWIIRKSTEFLFMIVKQVCRKTPDGRINVAINVGPNSIIFKSYRSETDFWNELESE